MQSNRAGMCGAITGACVLWAAPISAEIVVFLGDTTIEGGWDAFEDELTGIEMMPIVAGVEDFQLVSTIDTPNGPLLMTRPHEKRSFPESWLFWSHGGPVTGELFFTNESMFASYFMPANVRAFDLYLGSAPFMPLAYIVQCAGSEGSVVQMSIEASIDGAASHVGFSSTADEVITNIQINAFEPIFGIKSGFAVAEMRIGTESETCPGDLNSDGSVGPPDLALLLGQWGAVTNSVSDLDRDGIVGPADLALLLGAWGRCPG